MLSSGDEIGQRNGYEYRGDPALREDSRNLHRTAFNWDDAALRGKPGTVQQRIWDGLRQLEQLRAAQPCFGPDAWVTTWDTHSNHVLAIVRKTQNHLLVCLFNFSGQEQEVWLDAIEGEFTDLISGNPCCCQHCAVAPYQYCLCLRTDH